MRIGLFGGTYNPVHFGHLRAATEVREAFGLDRVVLIPAALPPHKQNQALAASEDRLKMLRMAVDGDAGFEISDVEIRRSGPSYTIDTLSHFRGSLPSQTNIFLIMGLDAMLEIDTWKAHRRLLDSTPVIVVSRPDSSGQAADGRWERLEGYLQKTISAGYAFSDTDSAFVASGRAPIYIKNVSALDISSTRIRELAASGRSIRYLVPRRVAEYIDTKGLYA